MHTILMLGGAVLFPVLCMVLLLGLDHLDETLEAGMRKRLEAVPAPARAVRAVPAPRPVKATRPMAARPVAGLPVAARAESRGLSAAS